MKIGGERYIDEDKHLVYAAATDLPGLASEFIQVSHVEVLSPHSCRITIHLNFGIYSGEYFADLHIEDDKPPHAFSIRGLHKSKLGGMSLKCTTYLTSETGIRTFVRMEGDFKMSGMLRFANKTIVRKGVEFGIKLMLDTIEKRTHLYDQNT